MTRSRGAIFDCSGQGLALHFPAVAVWDLVFSDRSTPRVWKSFDLGDAAYHAIPIAEIERVPP
jgi:hypothetical protein